MKVDIFAGKVEKGGEKSEIRIEEIGGEKKEGAGILHKEGGTRKGARRVKRPWFVLGKAGERKEIWN